jgi:hypothetical protein
LDLTDQQKAQIKETVAAKKPEMVGAVKSVWEKRTALVDAVLTDNSDEQTINQPKAQ